MAVMTQTPIMDFCYKFDLKNRPLFVDYHLSANGYPYEHWNNLLMKEIDFRFKHKLNFVYSVEGSQGMGKSYFSLAVNKAIAKVYGVPFTVDEVVFEIEDLNEKLSKCGERETFLLDEQRQSNFGAMSQLIKKNLSDYEDELRLMQVNLGYCSPDARDHSHFFVFKVTGYITRDEKDLTGKPLFFDAMLYTKRFEDDEFVERGLLHLPMVEPEFADAYEQKKREHLKQLQERKYRLPKEIIKDADFIYEKYINRLIIPTKTSFKIASKDRIELIIFKEIGMGKYTNYAVKLLITALKEKLNEFIFSLESEEKESFLG